MKKQSLLCVLLCIFLLLPLFSCGLGGGTGNPDTGQKPATRTESNDTKPIEPKPTEPGLASAVPTTISGIDASALAEEYPSVHPVFSVTSAMKSRTVSFALTVL